MSTGSGHARSAVDRPRSSAPVHVLLSPTSRGDVTQGCQRLRPSADDPDRSDADRR
jgi:hypothetical protein